MADYEVKRIGNIVIIEMPLEAIKRTAETNDLIVCSDDILDDLVEQLQECDGIDVIVASELHENRDRWGSVSEKAFGPIAALLLLALSLLMPAPAAATPSEAEIQAALKRATIEARANPPRCQPTASGGSLCSWRRGTVILGGPLPVK